MTVWTPERTAELHRLRDAGLSTSQIAAQLGCTTNAVYSKRSDLVTHPQRHATHPNATPERLAAIRRLLADGLTVMATGERLGVTKNVVCGLIARHGLRAGLPPSPHIGPLTAANAARAAKADGLPPPPRKPAATLKGPRVMKPRAPGKPLPEFVAVVKGIAIPEPVPGQHRVPQAPRYRWLDLARPPGVATYAPAPDRKCQYPMNDGAGRRWLFCEAATPETGPYCEAHAERCYAGRPSRGGGAA